ncbi:hypothetical protein [Agreia sp. COWG]|nr:hypothetical protein [Agreia sp. COWG]CAD5994981.1 protein of unknown function [Agreia sp. COWG]
MIFFVGIMELPVGAQLWVGLMMLAFGMLTLIAFGLGYLRTCRALRAR